MQRGATRGRRRCSGSLADHGHQGLVGDRGKQQAQRRRRRPVDVVVVNELLEEQERRAPRVAEPGDGNVHVGLHENHTLPGAVHHQLPTGLLAQPAGQHVLVHQRLRRGRWLSRRRQHVQ